jgi:hypothetical protein
VAAHVFCVLGLVCTGILPQIMSNVYAGLVIASIFMSVSVTWIVQGVMHVCGILKDGFFDYLVLWNYKTVTSIAIIIMAAICTVYIVMHKLLKATPGDLIYDRQ